MKIRVWLLCLLIDLFVIAGRAEGEPYLLGSADHYFYAFDPIAGSAGAENALINRAYPGFRISQMAQFLKTPACLWN